MLEAIGAGLLVCGVALGAALQRITGIGFASVSGPMLILAWGPVVGVQAVNVLSAICSLALLATLWRHVDLRRSATLTVGALAATPVGVGVALAAPAAWLQVGIGVVMLGALFAVAPLSRWALMRSWKGALLTGLAGGVANATVGQVGPLVGAYALASRWEMTSYVASMQLSWFVVNTATVVLKGIPPVAPVAGIALVIALALGLTAGVLLARVVSRRSAERLLFLVALVGSALVLGKGFLSLLAP